MNLLKTHDDIYRRWKWFTTSKLYEEYREACRFVNKLKLLIMKTTRSAVDSKKNNQTISEIYIRYLRTKPNINHRKSLDCFSKYFPLRSQHFCMRLNQLSKHFFHSDCGISKTCILNASTASSGVEKRWSLTLFFTYGTKKTLFGAKSGLYVR